MVLDVRLSLVLALATLLAGARAQRADWVRGFPDGCTSITLGREAMADGSVVTSHTCDSHRTRAWLDVVAGADHGEGAKKALVRRENDDSLAMPAYRYAGSGEIPQVAHTFGYINTAYPCMNERQLAIGESTFGGREELRSKAGLIDCQQLVQLMMERCSSAREAILTGGELLAKYGWNDAGECLTIADPREVWHLEIVGPGAGRVGAIWVAQRVPDDQVAVNANASRIRVVDANQPDRFLFSKDLTALARERGWWDPVAGPFEFCYAYAPHGRTSLAARRREWRVLDLLAPSLELDPNAENYPFSVKPDKPVTVARLIAIFQDYYEGTPFNFVKNITSTDEQGKTVISPFANPFMPYDMNPLFKINGGWGELGERTIARWYTMYATITQSRAGLPDEVGGRVWLAFDNAASSIYVPLHAGITDVARSYKTPGRVKGFDRGCAWWAFNRLGTLAAQRWGDMRKDVTAVWGPLQRELIAAQEGIEKRALALLAKDRGAARALLTSLAIQQGERVVARAWKLGDELWTKYDEKF